MHPALVTELTGSKPYYRQGGLIPHLSRRGLFWKSTQPAIHETVYIYQYHLDSTVSTRMEQVEQVEKIPCGWTPPLPRLSDYNPHTGLHKSLGIDSVQGASQYWIAKDGTTSKAASPAGPPSWSASVQGLTQHFEHLSMKGGTHASEVGSFLDDPSDPPEKVQLNHEEVSWEYYTGHCFAVPELVPGIDRHHGTRLKMNALGGEFICTLNHEIVFSTALTGRPKKKLFFSQYCWKRCVIGTTEDYADATSKQEWEFALMKGDLHGLQSFDTKETIVLRPYHKTEYLNVAAYLEAFWGYIWPTVCHNNVPSHEEWTTNLHGGLKEFIDHAISTLGRTHLKPTTGCLRGVATNTTGESTQGRYKMNLSDLKNDHYAVAVREAMMDLILGRSNTIVKVGDVVEMLLSISFAVKDSMLDWQWLGINPQEWPPQRLDWEMYRLGHLAFASNMEEQMAGWIEHPWHVLYSALRCLACQDWKRPHSCPICRALNRNVGGTHDAWSHFEGCLTHLDTEVQWVSVARRSLEWSWKFVDTHSCNLANGAFSEEKARDWLPALTILYMAPGGHRQWPLSIKPLLDRLSWIVLKTRPLALMHLSEALHDNPGWQPMYRHGPRVDQVSAVPYKFLDIGTKMGQYHLEELLPRRGDKSNILHPRHTGMGIPPVNTFHSVVQKRVGNQHIDKWCVENGSILLLHMTSGSLKHQSIGGDYLFLSQRVRRRCSVKGQD